MPGGPDRLRLHAAQRQGRGHLGDEPGRSEAATASCSRWKAAAGACRTGRPTERSCWSANYISVSESISIWSTSPSGEKVLLTPREGAEAVFYASARFGGDGKGIYVITDRDSEFQRLAYLDLATETAPLADPPSSGTWTSSTSPRTARPLAFVINEDGLGGPAPAGHGHAGRSVRRRSSPRAWSRPGVAPEQPRPGLHLVLRRAAPTDVYSLDVTTGKVDALDRERDRRPEHRAPSSSRSWSAGRAFDGRASPASSTGPPRRFTGQAAGRSSTSTAGRKGQFRPGFLGRNNYFINELGVAMIYPNVRGSTGYGKTFLKLDNGLQREGLRTGHRRAAGLDRDAAGPGRRPRSW